MEECMQEEKRAAAPKKKWSIRKIKKRWWVLAAVVVLAAAGALALHGLGGQKAAAAVNYQETAAERRDITKSLTGSGTLEPADSYTVSTLVSGEVLSDTFEEGDLVGEGQLLYSLDSSDASTSQT